MQTISLGTIKIGFVAIKYLTNAVKVIVSTRSFINEKLVIFTISKNNKMGKDIG